ncbi:hypothetical protein [Nocardioides aromaticivorans]|uniref:hypothetical protein n=1 Tax=Nocardioides aromaticivorans TaxID=200618 RepID=UPI001A8D4392|nr:hypothetical protein [Nocardioides aromaticivorans]
MSDIGRGIGMGAPGFGGTPSPHQTIPAKCGGEGHPGVTYNPWHDTTWCLCGEVVTKGNRVVWPKPTDCGGPLVHCRHLEPDFAEAS